MIGISRDSWHKRRNTGGHKNPLRKKRKFELGRPPANTRVSQKKPSRRTRDSARSRSARNESTRSERAAATKNAAVFASKTETILGAPKASRKNRRKFEKKKQLSIFSNHAKIPYNRRSLQREQQRVGSHEDAREELHRSSRQYAVSTVVRNALLRDARTKETQATEGQRSSG